MKVYKPTLFQVARFVRRFTWTVVSSELLANQPVDQRPRTVALELWRESCEERERERTVMRRRAVKIEREMSRQIKMRTEIDEKRDRLEEI